MKKNSDRQIPARLLPWENPAASGSRLENGGKILGITLWHSLSSRSNIISICSIFWKVDFCKPGIDREHDCITRNKTWSLVKRKPVRHALPCKYIFEVKDCSQKVRLVPTGCRKIHGVDYSRTFGPVVSLTTLRTILVIASYHNPEFDRWTS